MTTPRKLSARYELGEILGFGGMSEVHKGKDLRLERDVAIKVLRADLARDPTFYLRFKREAQNAAALNHPAIVAVYDTGEAESDDGTQLPYIVMEYVDGETLRDIVRSKGPMPSRRAMEVIADTCAALDFSHRHGIIHRDIKPANIMINKAGAVKVMDFGIARAIADSSSPMTQTAAVIGTAQYLSPEQARGEQVDPRSDVYSLGCVLYEILTGQPPFTGDSPVAVAYQHVREDPEPPSLVHPGVPRELDSIILKAMAKNPANRYQTAAEMRSDIIRVLGGQKPAAPTVMTDEDRTTILGSLDSSPRRFKTDGSDAPRVPVSHAARPDTGESPGRRRTIRIAVLVIAAIGVIALVGGFLVRQSGADQIGIPDVAGQPALQAQSTLKGLGFKVETSEKFDNLVASGNVIATRPLADSRIPEGSTVTLEVSKGPESVQVPKLSGLTQTQAQQVLEAQGLRLDPTIQKAPSSTAEVDHITEQEPSAGSNVKIDSTVKITIGSGPEQVRIPNVVGQTIDVAQPNLEGAGFKVEIEQIVSAKPKGEVVSTSPAGGTSADKGSTVRVQVSQGDQIPMPDLNGKSVSDALAALRSAGWSGTADQLQQTPQATLVPEQVGRVLSQAPAPGSQVSRTAAIQVGIGAFAFGR